MNKAVFLDRDGVINEIVFHEDVEVLDSPFNIRQVRIIKGAFEAIVTFNQLGYKVLLATNQPGAAKGKMSLARIEEVNRYIVDMASKSEAYIDHVYCCTHHPVGTPEGDPALIKRCKCRKPGTGLLLAGIDEYQIDINLSFMVGDSISDIQAGKAIGLNTVLVGDLKCDARRLYEEKDCLPDSVFQDLNSFAQSLKS
jgi:mannose-1-phosphate guanylyltransferase / phosphomannomutase